ncbi:MAG: hypothetical protein ACOCWE_03955 [Bacillota bacterium]
MIYNRVSNWLSRFFVLHFIIDMIFAIPLFFFPESFLSFFGWQAVDPVMTRLVAAALFGIGIESLLGRNGSRESFKAMLNLKIIWSLGAIGGLLLSMEQSPADFIIWVVLFTFIAFNILWVYWRIRLN